MSVGRRPDILVRPVGDGCQLDRRHGQTVSTSRTERSAARQVGEIFERAKVLRRKSVQDYVDENGNRVLNSLRHAQPVEADKRVGDVVGSTQMICQSRSRVH